MIKLTADEQHLLVTVVRQYPKFASILNAWRTMELERLPFASNENLDVLRGRVQTLTELQKALNTSP